MTSPVQITAALDTLRAAGFSVSAPASHRLQLISAAEFAALAGWKDVRRARRAIHDHFRRVVNLPGGDLRVYLVDVEGVLAGWEQPRIEVVIPKAA